MRALQNRKKNKNSTDRIAWFEQSRNFLTVYVPKFLVVAIEFLVATLKHLVSSTNTLVDTAKKRWSSEYQKITWLLQPSSSLREVMRIQNRLKIWKLLKIVWYNKDKSFSKQRNYIFLRFEKCKNRHEAEWISVFLFNTFILFMTLWLTLNKSSSTNL